MILIRQNATTILTQLRRAVDADKKAVKAADENEPPAETATAAIPPLRAKGSARARKRTKAEPGVRTDRLLVH